MIAKFSAVSFEARKKALELLAPFNPRDAVQDGPKYTIVVDDRPIDIARVLGVKQARAKDGFARIELDTLPVITLIVPYVEHVTAVIEFTCGICGQTIQSRDDKETGHSQECPVHIAQGAN